MKEKFVYVQEFKCKNSDVLEQQLSMVKIFIWYDLPKEVTDFKTKTKLIQKGPDTIFRVSITCELLDALKLAAYANEYFTDKLIDHEDWKI